jgi:hypothetical protein
MYIWAAFLMTTRHFKVSITVDPEEFPVPTDGDVDEELIDILRDLLFDIDGAETLEVVSLAKRKKNIHAV